MIKIASGEKPIFFTTNKGGMIQQKNANEKKEGAER